MNAISTSDVKIQKCNLIAYILSSCGYTVVVFYISVYEVHL